MENKNDGDDYDADEAWGLIVTLQVFLSLAF